MTLQAIIDYFENVKKKYGNIEVDHMIYEERMECNPKTGDFEKMIAPTWWSFNLKDLKELFHKEGGKFSYITWGHL